MFLEERVETEAQEERVREERFGDGWSWSGSARPARSRGARSRRVSISMAISAFLEVQPWVERGIGAVTVDAPSW